MSGRSKEWRLLIDGAMNGAENMARDEALARCVDGHAPVVLRAYSFDPPTVTIGRFQKVPAGIDPETSALGEIEVVRRPTGGLAILHANDFTYSVVMPSSGWGARERDRVFDTIAQAIIEALDGLGIQAEQVLHKQGARRQGDWCFEGVFGVDLQWRGRKICGSAQKSFAGSILQHGSLFLREPDTDVLSIVTTAESQRWGQAPFATLSEAAGRDVTWDHMLAAFRSAFERALGVVFKPYSLTQEEEKLSRRLAVEKYGDRGWLRNPKRTSHVRRL